VALPISAKPANKPVGSGNEVLQENHPTARWFGILGKLTKGYLMNWKLGDSMPNMAIYPARIRKGKATSHY
jgi:hypothetical protein